MLTRWLIFLWSFNHLINQLTTNAFHQSPADRHMQISDRCVPTTDYGVQSSAKTCYHKTEDPLNIRPAPPLLILNAHLIPTLCLNLQGFEVKTELISRCESKPISETLISQTFFEGFKAGEGGKGGIWYWWVWLGTVWTPLQFSRSRRILESDLETRVSAGRSSAEKLWTKLNTE